MVATPAQLSPDGIISILSSYTCHHILVPHKYISAIVIGQGVMHKSQCVLICRSITFRVSRQNVVM